MSHFDYNQDGYTVWPGNFERAETHRGVMTICQVFRGDDLVCTLDDEPEAIVARVTFEDESERAPMVAIARASGVQAPGDSDAAFLSEYLRDLTMKADRAMLEDMQP